MTTISFTPFPILSTARLNLRQAELTDDADLLFLRTDPDVNRYLDTPAMQSHIEARALIDKLNRGIARNEWIFWSIALKNDPRMIGTICLWNIVPNKQLAEAGYTLHPEHQHKGLMKEALQAVLNYGFVTLGLKTIEAHTHPDNLASLNLLEGCRFLRDPALLPTEQKPLVLYRLNAVNHS